VFWPDAARRNVNLTVRVNSPSQPDGCFHANDIGHSANSVRDTHGQQGATRPPERKSEGAKSGIPPDAPPKLLSPSSCDLNAELFGGSIHDVLTAICNVRIFDDVAVADLQLLEMLGSEWHVGGMIVGHVAMCLSAIQNQRKTRIWIFGALPNSLPNF
jgi:hypothetical protein